MPAMKNIAPQVPPIRDRLAEVRLGDQQGRGDTEQDHGEQVAGDVGLPRVLGEQPGADDDEGRLHELRRLDREAERDSQRRAPLTSTPTNSTGTIMISDPRE
jgi:hypothetical protein